MSLESILTCPLCNGLEQVTKKCPACGDSLQDGGRVENYYGPYSPYEEVNDSYASGENICIHLLYCPSCGWDKRVGVSKLII
ncbi:hypothetical protein RDV78_02395 [Bacillota bacterium LX-D]|nr:hypothetical protein [Bacillota bacterium LX-D]